MKNAIRIIVSLIIIALAASLVSCSHEDLGHEPYDQIIIDPENPQFYLYSNNIDGKSWREVINIPLEDGSDYFFSANDNKVRVQIAGNPKEAKYYPRSDDKNYIVLHIEAGEVSYHNVTTDGTFRFSY